MGRLKIRRNRKFIRTWYVNDLRQKLLSGRIDLSTLPEVSMRFEADVKASQKFTLKKLEELNHRFCWLTCGHQSNLTAEQREERDRLTEILRANIKRFKRHRFFKVNGRTDEGHCYRSSGWFIAGWGYKFGSGFSYLNSCKDEVKKISPNPTIQEWPAMFYHDDESGCYIAQFNRQEEQKKKNKEFEENVKKVGLTPPQADFLQHLVFHCKDKTLKERDIPDEFKRISLEKMAKLNYIELKHHPLRVKLTPIGEAVFKGIRVI